MRRASVINAARKFVYMYNRIIGSIRAGAQIVIKRLIEKGILIPKDKDKKYGQSYVYREYLDIFIGKD